MKCQDSAFWKEVINDEIDSIMGNQTWILVDLSPSSKPISCKWIFKKKMKVDGTIDKFKASFRRYSDASWITCLEIMHFTSGWIFILGGGAIAWGSKKQTCIIDSTMAAEFIALAAASKEAEWLRNLLYDVPSWSKPISPISICCVSEATPV
ncbi:hypothetical protein CXB51_006273 [Gossypium anomalum]|uniref:Reverse transcriptase Ty1/copia-type domain-containing protein n=1 Tax=Gossypium anomalum TaxID=47600 RepID=A0A8J5Z387_9ROSI|nr:hypothetical protein CXB51_006273 [Gossypium anomalum]